MLRIANKIWCFPSYSVDRSFCSALNWGRKWWTLSVRKRGKSLRAQARALWFQSHVKHQIHGSLHAKPLTMISRLEQLALLLYLRALSEDFIISVLCFPHHSSYAQTRKENSQLCHQDCWESWFDCWIACRTMLPAMVRTVSHWYCSCSFGNKATSRYKVLRQTVWSRSPAKNSKSYERIHSFPTSCFPVMCMSST